MERQPCVYILAKASHSTMYVGVTSNLIGRIHQHRTGAIRGFTKKNGIHRLVWFEGHDTMETAIIREKRIKRWLRPWKYELIFEANPHWRDLAEDFGFDPLPRSVIPGLSALLSEVEGRDPPVFPSISRPHL